MQKAKFNVASILSSFGVVFICLTLIFLSLLAHKVFWSEPGPTPEFTFIGFVLTIVGNGIVSPIWQELIYRGVLWECLHRSSVLVQTIYTTIPFVCFHYFTELSVERFPLIVLFSLVCSLARSWKGLPVAMLVHIIANTLATILPYVFPGN
jgi:membrane protease YdiL (CAAX protease family)